jgi:hypothetical protein
MGFRRWLMRATSEVEVRSPTGLILGDRLAYSVDLERLFKVVARIVKGLFYHEAGFRLSDHYETIVHSMDSLAQLEPQAHEQIARTIIRPLTRLPAKVIGVNTFNYRFKFFEEDPHASVWGLSFYASIPFLAATFGFDAPIGTEST